MLDRVYPWGRPVRAHTAARIYATIASERWQIDAYFRLRREIFAEEQALFSFSDRDELDSDATPIVAQGEIAGMPDGVVGVVRIYRAAAEPHTWYGGRLGVSRAYRRVGAVGSALITEAVATAHGWGCRRFLATVQAANARYFERHHFRRLRPIELLGHAHFLMEAELEHYPPQLSSSFRTRAS